MVTRVYGRLANKYDLIFIKQEGKNRWDCVVPLLPSADYVVELFADDEAGNTSFFATILLIVDLERFTADIKILTYNVDIIEESFIEQFRKQNIIADAKATEYNTMLKINTFSTELMEEVVE